MVLGMVDFKTKQIMVCRDGSHSKFYEYWLGEDELTTYARFGRIGTPGKSEAGREHGHRDLASCYLRRKAYEKTRKGYVNVDYNEFNRLSLQAAIVGTQNKCGDFHYVEFIDGNQFRMVSEERLADPECKVGFMLDFSTRKPYDGLTDFILVIKPDASIVAYGQLDMKILPNDHAIYELADKVRDAVGCSFI